MITGVDTYVVGNPWKNWLFVRLETDEGLYRIGEGTLNGFAKTVETAIHQLDHLYVGMSPFDVETIILGCSGTCIRTAHRARASRGGHRDGLLGHRSSAKPRDCHTTT